MASKKGYGIEVDWWSLGVLIYEMLVGKCPFKEPKEINDYKFLLKTPIYPTEYINDTSKNIIESFLTIDPKKRLGYGINGINNIKQHNFFEDINWNDLYNKKIKPEFIPEIKNDLDVQYFDKNFTSEKIFDNENILKIEQYNDYINFAFIHESVQIQKEN